MTDPKRNALDVMARVVLHDIISVSLEDCGTYPGINADDWQEIKQRVAALAADPADAAFQLAYNTLVPR